MHPPDESELGVPFPGAVVQAHRRTDPLLVPPPGEFDWDQTFGARAQRVVDLGCGTGRYLVSSALARPGHQHLGLEVVPRVVEHAARRAGRRGLTNLRFVVGDAVEWIFDRLADDSVDELHLYHPQPSFDPAVPGARMLTPEFMERMWRVLVRDGALVLQTDHARYGAYLFEALPKYFEVHEREGPWPDAPDGRTRREIIGRMKGLRIRRAIAQKRATPLPGDIPRVDFDTRRVRRPRSG